MTKEDALTLALEALEKKAGSWGVGQESLNSAAITAVKEALAQPERPWVGLTEQEKQEWIDAMPYDIETRHCMILVNVIEAKLKEKNT